MLNQWIQNQQKVVKKTVIRYGLIFATVFCVFTSFQSVSAQTTSIESASVPIAAGLDVIEKPLGLPKEDIRVIIARIIRIALGLIGIIMVVLLMYGGYLWMSAGGNSEQISKAQQVLKNAAIGLAIILSSYAITIFVMRIFGIGDSNGDQGGGSGAGGVQTQNFEGSGALGGIIKDHYPTRDQLEVPRNTRIIITFRKPIRLASFVQNTNQTKDVNGNEIFGDCVNIGDKMNWQTDCDSLVLDSDHISIERADTKEKINGASVLASVENGKVYTIVIRPYDYLGSNSEKISYKVHLGKSIQLDDPANNNPPAFETKILGNDYYEWQFSCSTALDTVPPHVGSVFPGNKSVEAKNSVIQIDFSEAMDPTGIQGKFTQGNDVYALEGNNIYLKSSQSNIPLGNFSLTNGYRTLEFTSTKECGKNACGSKIYCLPVCDKAGSSCNQDTYELLVKAAKTFSSNSFEAIPFSGAMDVAGNALDGNDNKKVDSAGNAGAAFADQKKPDNYFWSFNLKDEIDLTAPFVKTVTPGLDATYVNAQDRLSVLFSKRMRVDSLYSISIDQHPPREIPLCRAPSATFNDLDSTTLTNILHCPFVQGTRNYYLPNITSEVEDVHYNCFYPGKGPGGDVEIGQRLKESSVCDSTGKNCCAVNADSPSTAFCCNGKVSATQSTVEDCVKFIRSTSL